MPSASRNQKLLKNNTAESLKPKFKIQKFNTDGINSNKNAELNFGSEKILDGFGVPFDRDTLLKYTFKSVARMRTARGYYRYVTLVLTNRELYFYHDLKMNKNHQRLIVMGPDLGVHVSSLPEFTIYKHPDEMNG